MSWGAAHQVLIAWFTPLPQKDEPRPIRRSRTAAMIFDVDDLARKRSKMSRFR